MLFRFGCHNFKTQVSFWLKDITIFLIKNKMYHLKVYYNKETIAINFIITYSISLDLQTFWLIVS